MSRSIFLLPLLIGAAVAGCFAPGMGGLSMNATIAGGEVIPINFDSKGVVHAENADWRVETAALDLAGKDKSINYVFKLRQKRGGSLRRIAVEDVTDDRAVPLLTDDHPHFEGGIWMGKSGVIDPADSSFRWVNEIENSVRVYRFTLVDGTGRTQLMYEGAGYPAFVKHFLRLRLGLEKPDRPR